MSEPTEPEDVIRENLVEGVSSVSVDGLTVQSHSLNQQVVGARFLAEQAASANPFRAIKSAKLAPPGTVGACPNRFRE